MPDEAWFAEEERHTVSAGVQALGIDLPNRVSDFGEELRATLDTPRSTVRQIPRGDGATQVWEPSV